MLPQCLVLLCSLIHCIFTYVRLAHSSGSILWYTLVFRLERGVCSCGVWYGWALSLSANLYAHARGTRVARDGCIRFSLAC